jgi:hypothetical protein
MNFANYILIIQIGLLFCKFHINLTKYYTNLLTTVTNSTTLH